jgi:Fe-S-cluster-containing dehydrogenase component
MDKNDGNKETKKEELSRRQFLIAGGTSVAGGVVISGTSGLLAQTPSTNKYPKAKGHIEHDSKLCSGCLSCMIACSLAHEGNPSMSFSRIQVSRYVFDDFPQDIQGYPCQQCDEPKCVANCPTGACHVDTSNGNVRTIDAKKCIGCQTCFKSCVLTPRRLAWNSADKKALKCDLCADAPINTKPGSPACVNNCPQKALKLVI